MTALILLSSLGVIALLAEIFSFKRILYPLVIIGLIATFVVNVFDWNLEKTVFFGMMDYNHFAVAFSSVLIAVSILWFIMAEGFFREQSNLTDHFALIIFSLIGGVIMVSYSNMTMLFLGIEILSIPMYVLAGSRKEDVSSNEAGFKYLIMGAFATGFLLFGITLVYGSTGSFDLAIIREAIANSAETPSILFIGILLMLVGLAFKVSAVPFHFWAPDVYQGAPIPVTTFMATIVKTSAFAALLRLFLNCFSETRETWSDVIWVMAALTLLLGNITAVLQLSIKRMLAYSSIAHAGYMLLALLALNEYAASSILYYTLAYSIGSIITFGILALVIDAKGSDTIESWNGLGKTNPVMAICMTVALLSLAGIPPAAGFFAKYYIFTSAFQAGYPGLVFIAIIASLVGVYYYFRIIIAMYFKESAEGSAVPVSFRHRLLFIVCATLTILLFIFPDFIIRLL